MINPAEFDRPEQRLDFIRQVQRGCVDLKYAYTGTSADAHIRFATSGKYREVTDHRRAEAALLSDPRLRAASRFVDIGPGNGIHSLDFLRTLFANGVRIQEYVGVDYSRVLARASADNLSGTWQKSSITSWTFTFKDLETESLKLALSGDSSTLFAILGNTLGNVRRMGPFVRNATYSKQAGDYLVVGVTPQGSLEPSELLAPYRSEYFRTAALAPFAACGIDITNIHLELAASVQGVIASAVFKTRVEVPFEEKKIVFDAGYSVRCFGSRRFTYRQVRRLMNRCGWSVRRTVNLDGGLAVLCSDSNSEGLAHP